MDEVGRGTTVKDGLAISFATLHHLASINRSRCLFATHFHELADMVGSENENEKEQRLFHSVRFYCSDINDTEVSPHSNLCLANANANANVGWPLRIFLSTPSWHQSQ